jgi:hypothetical protein
MSKENYCVTFINIGMEILIYTDDIHDYKIYIPIILCVNIPFSKPLSGLMP